MKNDVPILGKDVPMDNIRTRICRVVEFIPYGKIENNKVVSIPNFPYASLDVESKELQSNVILQITHKEDFSHLWEVFKKRGINNDEDVLIVWSDKNYKSWLIKLFSAFMPKLIVMVCKKESYELITDKNFKPELQGEARYLAEKPIVELKPEVME